MPLTAYGFNSHRGTCGRGQNCRPPWWIGQRIAPASGIMAITPMNDVRENTNPEATTRGRLIGLIRQILGQPAGSRPLPIDARLSDLGMSSIKMVNLMLAVEVEFAITIPQAAITPENFASIASVEALVLKLTASDRGG